MDAILVEGFILIAASIRLRPGPPKRDHPPEEEVSARAQETAKPEKERARSHFKHRPH